jgi:hypothetical protein
MIPVRKPDASMNILLMVRWLCETIPAKEGIIFHVLVHFEFFGGQRHGGFHSCD